VKKNFSNEKTKLNKIGEMLLEAGKLKPADIDAIIKAQQRLELYFGEVAVKLGLVTKEDVMQVVSQQFGYVKLSLDDNSIDSSIITAFSGHEDMIESFRRLRNKLLLYWFLENKCLVITAPHKKHGTSHICANLAVMFSKLGKKTLLIDANMHSPSQKNNFKIKNRVGLSDVLVNRVNVKEAIYKDTGLDNLSILSSGTLPPNPSELIDNGKFIKLKEKLEEFYEIVIIDSPPILELGDAQTLIAIVKGALIVARKHNTNIEDIEKAKEQILVAQAKPVGVVLNSFK
jgi:chain length determinant protein tyrosine kinase EpsG